MVSGQQMFQAAVIGASVSTANKSIYVDKEASGAADGTSYTDAFTTIQDAVDSMEDVIIHAYTIYVRDGTKKNGTCDSNVANKVHDTGEFLATTTWVGRRVFNVDDGTWGVVSARDSDDQLSIVDTAGAALDLCPDGNEVYYIEPTPYREQIELNTAPATYPSHLILGSVMIEGEHYWGANCDAQANAGEILDASVDFTSVEVGDRVYVIDLNGANGRAQDAEYGTVDDVSQVASHIVRTTLTKTPTTNWKYVIVKTEISGSDDGTGPGTARGSCFTGKRGATNISIYGFYMTFSDSLVVTASGVNWTVYYNIFQDCDYGIRATDGGFVNAYYNCYKDTPYSVWVQGLSYINARYSFFDTTGYGVYSVRMGHPYTRFNYFVNCSTAIHLVEFSYAYVGHSTIENSVTTGLYARHNSAINTASLTNSATTPVDPIGTSEGAYIV